MGNKQRKLNFFAHPTPANKQDTVESARKRLEQFYSDVGLDEVPQDVS